MVNLGSTHFLQFSIQYASIALLYYDYALTFGMEVKYIWGQKFRLSTVLYILCRYGLVANVVYLFTIAGKINLTVVPPPGRCDAGYKIAAALSVLGRLAIIVVWGARTWAVFGRNLFVLIFFGLIGLTCMILDIVHVPIISCRGNSSIPLIGGVLSILMCVFEICSAFLTTVRSIQALRVGGPWHTQKKGFMYLLLEQGVLYFVIVTAFTIASLILNVRVPGGFLQRLLNAITLPLSGMMTARFLLHLRKWEAKHSAFATSNENREHADAGAGAGSTVMDFASVHDRGTVRSGSADESEFGFGFEFEFEFGGDPVRRARQRGGNQEFSMGGVADSRRSVRSF